MNRLFDLDRARNLMDKYDIEAIITSSTDNFGYLTDYWTHYGKYFDIGWIGDPCLHMAVLPLEKGIEPFLLSVGHLADVEYVNPWIKDRRNYRPPGYGGFLGKGDSDFYQAFAEVLKEKGLDKSKLGIELGYEGYTIEVASATMVERLRSLLPSAKFKDASTLLREMRLLKTDEEMNRIKTAGKITDHAIKASFEEVTGGMPKVELEWVIRKNLIQDRIDTILLNINYGENDILRPNEKKLQKGDFIRIDLALKYKQYYSDVAKCAIYGEPTSDLQKLYNAIVKAHNNVVEKLDIGVKCSEIFNSAKKSLKESGYDYPAPLVGHGIGICVHEAPYLGNNDMIIQPGMTFSLEMLGQVGKGSWAGTEDMIICDKSGCHDITKIGKELIKV